MLASGLVLLIVVVTPGLVLGAALVAISCGGLAPEQRVPLRWWTRWDVWHHVWRGARELTRVRSRVLRP